MSWTRMLFALGGGLLFVAGALTGVDEVVAQRPDVGVRAAGVAAGIGLGLLVAAFVRD